MKSRRSAVPASSARKTLQHGHAARVNALRHNSTAPHDGCSADMVCCVGIRGFSRARFTGYGMEQERPRLALHPQDMRRTCWKHEDSPGRSGSLGSLAWIDQVTQFLGRLEVGYALGWHLHAFARLWVASDAGIALPDAE